MVAVQEHIVVQGCTSSLIRTIDGPYLMDMYSRALVSNEFVGVLKGKEASDDRFP